MALQPSTSSYDLRVWRCDRTLRNVDVDVAASADQRTDLLRDRQLEAQVATVAEADLRSAREHQRNLAAPRADRPYGLREHHRNQGPEGVHRLGWIPRQRGVGAQVDVRRNPDPGKRRERARE